MTKRKPARIPRTKAALVAQIAAEREAHANDMRHARKIIARLDHENHVLRERLDSGPDNAKDREVLLALARHIRRALGVE